MFSQPQFALPVSQTVTSFEVASVNASDHCCSPALREQTGTSSRSATTRATMEDAGVYEMLLSIEKIVQVVLCA